MESSTRIPGIAEYYNNFTVISPHYGAFLEHRKILMKFVKKKAKIKEKMNNEGEVVEGSLEKFSTILQTADLDSIQSFYERPYEFSLVPNDFMVNRDVSNISFDGELSHFSFSWHSLNKMRNKIDHCNSNNNIVSIDNNIQTNQKLVKKKIQTKKFEPKKKMNNKQLINSQKSFKNIIQTYLKKENKQVKTSKPLFQKIQPGKATIKENSKINRDKNRNSNNKYDDLKIKTPQLPSHTPLSFKSNLRSTVQTNLTSRNNIISPTTFLKVNLTKENILENSRKAVIASSTKQLKPEINSGELISNKELANSKIFKTIISNLATPNKNPPGKCSKPPATKPSTVEKKEESKYVKKQPVNILGIKNTTSTASFSNSKASSVYNINLNLNLNPNFNNSSKCSSSNTTLKNQNILNTNNSQSKAKLTDFTNVISLKENKINIHESHIIKKINSPKKEDFNREFTSTNEQPLTDRLKSPKENLFKSCNGPSTHNTIDQATSKQKNMFSLKNLKNDNKSNVAFVNKILNVKDPNQKSQAKLKDANLKSVTPSLNTNGMNKLIKFNLDLKILDAKLNKEVPITTKTEVKTTLVKTEETNRVKDDGKKISKAVMMPLKCEAQGLKIPNFEKVFDVKKYLSNNTAKVTATAKVSSNKRPSVVGKKK